MSKLDLSPLYFITNEWSDKSIIKQIEDYASGGGTLVQLRIKEKPIEDVRSIAIEVKALCDQLNIKLIINDYVELARELNVDGVHIGKRDKNPKDTRSIIGKDMILGCTANSFNDINALPHDDIDYIGLGPYQFTSTKKNLSTCLGLEGYNDIITQCKKHCIDIPIYAIGGINIQDIELLIQSGIYGVSVSGAIANTEDVHLSTQQFINRINIAKK
ncbi:MAG: thiamine phosphate synthase [Hyphomicrobiales bacterium]